MIIYMRVIEYFEQRMGKHILIKKLHKRYQQEGIQIPFPSRDVYVQKNMNKNLDVAKGDVL